MRRSAGQPVCSQFHKPDAIVHFAAESHVDRSILSAEAFFQTNLRGTFTLLEAARAAAGPRFIHVSTDEVYGSIPEPDDADEEYPLKTSSPYSASKAGSDLLALSYYTTHKLAVSVTRASNNYGPCQFPEKLIPLMISNALENKPLPIYGDGMQVRDWLYVTITAVRSWPFSRRAAPARSTISAAVAACPIDMSCSRSSRSPDAPNRS